MGNIEGYTENYSLTFVTKLFYTFSGLELVTDELILFICKKNIAAKKMEFFR